MKKNILFLLSSLILVSCNSFNSKTGYNVFVSSIETTKTDEYKKIKCIYVSYTIEKTKTYYYNLNYYINDEEKTSYFSYNLIEELKDITKDEYENYYNLVNNDSSLGRIGSI